MEASARDRTKVPRSCGPVTVSNVLQMHFECCRALQCTWQCSPLLPGVRFPHKDVHGISCASYGSTVTRVAYESYKLVSVRPQRKLGNSKNSNTSFRFVKHKDTKATTALVHEKTRRTGLMRYFFSDTPRRKNCKQVIKGSLIYHSRSS